MSKIIKSQCVVFSETNSNSIEAARLSQEINAELNELYIRKDQIIKDAVLQSDMIKESAQKYRRAMISNMESEVESMKRKAYEEGYQNGFGEAQDKGYAEGFHNGSIEAKEKNTELLNELSNLINSIELEKQKIIEKYEDDLTSLAVNIAEKIIKQKIDIDDSVYSTIIKDCIQNYENMEYIRIYLSDEDSVNTVMADKSLIDNLSKITQNIKVEVCHNSKENGIIIETPENIVDIGVETQLDSLKKIILNT